MSAGYHSGSTSDSRCFPLCAHDYLAFRMLQAARQKATNQSLPRVGYSLGERGHSDAVVEWIPAAMIVQFAH